MDIGIAGLAGAGKDTLANYISDKLDMPIVHLADNIKIMLNAGFGWSMDMWNDREWKEAVQPLLGFSPREAAQKLGTEWRDAMGQPMLWCNMVDNDWPDQDSLVIPDIRFPHEQDWIRNSHQGIILLLLRPGTNYTVSPHASESSLDIAKVDYTIINHEGNPQVMFNEFDRIYEEVMNERKLNP